MLRPVSSDTVLTAATTRSARCRSGIYGFIMSVLIRPGSDRRVRAPEVDQIMADIVGSRRFEVSFNRLHHTLAVIAGRVRVCAGSGIGVFRGHHHALTVALHKLAEERFARPVRVHVSG